MKKLCLIIAVAFMLTAILPLVASAEDIYPGFRVQGRFLYDKDGEKVILYGVNSMIVWLDIDGEPTYSEIAKTGANVVRIVWDTNSPARKLDQAIYNCRKNHMIPMIELHDATGRWEDLPKLVDYWVDPDVVQVLKKHQEYLLVNIGNEVGNQVSEADFQKGYEDAITRMRNAGIHVPLIIDACNYGQNINMLQSKGPGLIEYDPDHNLMFSVHMWWPYMWGNTDQKVIDEINESVEMGLPLIVGEFGHQWDETANGKIPYKTIIEQCHLNEVGYLPWSWGPGNNPQTFLDMTTDGTFEGLQGWGLEVCITDTHSIKNIAVRPKSILSEITTEPPGNKVPPGSIAQGKPVVASSTEPDMGNVPENAVDGNIGTRWASQYSDPQYIYVDLEAEYEIERIYIEWEAAYAGQYKIQVSNDASTWTDIYTEYNSDGDIDDFAVSGKGRYVRIYCTQRATQWGNSIYEIGIYPKGGVTPPPPTPTVVPTPTSSGNILLGDIDFDGNVTSIDFAKLRMYLLGMIDFTEDEKKAADVDQDGRVTSIDFGWLRMYLLGMRSGF